MQYIVHTSTPKMKKIHAFVMFGKTYKWFTQQFFSKWLCFYVVEVWVKVYLLWSWMCTLLLLFEKVPITITTTGPIKNHKFIRKLFGIFLFSGEEIILKLKKWGTQNHNKSVNENQIVSMTFEAGSKLLVVYGRVWKILENLFLGNDLSAAHF